MKKRMLSMFVMLLFALPITGCDKSELEKAAKQAGTEISSKVSDELFKATENKADTFETATIVRVKDGDTVVCNVFGKEKTVRLIGVNTPESVSSDKSKNCEEGYVASDYTKSQLTKGMDVYLEYDEDNTDQYGRVLAYLWLSDQVDTASYEDFCKYNYGAILLQNTYCEAVYYAPNGKYRDWYEALDSEYDF